MKSLPFPEVETEERYVDPVITIILKCRTVLIFWFFSI